MKKLAIAFLLVASPLFGRTPHKPQEAARHFVMCGNQVGSDPNGCETTREAYVVLGPIRPKHDMVPPQTLNYLFVYIDVITGFPGTTCENDPEFSAIEEVGGTSMAEALECPEAHGTVRFKPNYGLPTVTATLDFGEYTRTITFYFQQSNATWERYGVIEWVAQERTGDCDTPGTVVYSSGFYNIDACEVN
jgi:hypothetical protein